MPPKPTETRWVTAPDASLQRVAVEALGVLQVGGALTRTFTGPRPTPEFAALLADAGSEGWPDSTRWPGIEVRCHRRRHHGDVLVVWTLDPIRAAVVPRRKAPPGEAAAMDGLSVWIDRANVNRGKVRHLAGTIDGHGYHGTHSIHCVAGSHKIPVTAERRLKLYLDAVAAGRKAIEL